MVNARRRSRGLIGDSRNRVLRVSGTDLLDEGRYWHVSPLVSETTARQHEPEIGSTVPVRSATSHDRSVGAAVASREPLQTVSRASAFIGPEWGSPDIRLRETGTARPLAAVTSAPVAVGNRSDVFWWYGPSDIGRLPYGFLTYRAVTVRFSDASPLARE